MEFVEDSRTLAQEVIGVERRTPVQANVAACAIRPGWGIESLLSLIVHFSLPSGPCILTVVQSMREQQVHRVWPSRRSSCAEAECAVVVVALPDLKLYPYMSSPIYAMSLCLFDELYKI